MKRSDINQLLTSAKEFLAAQKFLLPPFAAWSPHDWESVGPEGDEIRLNRLGWELTDFGSGQFSKCGQLLFTLRNGNQKDPTSVKSYAEKIMLVEENQVTPFHFHFQRTKDLINRGGGNLVVELYNSDAQERFTSEPVRLRCDGVLRTVRAGGSVTLRSGESITLPPRIYHKFFGEPGRGRVLVGEISSVTDDASDIRFSDPVRPSAPIEEDAAPIHFLCHEYPSASR